MENDQLGSRKKPWATAGWMLGAVLAVAAPDASAQQSAFGYQPAGAAIRFHYAYTDAASTAQHLAFRLPAAEIEAAMALFRDYAIPHLYLHIEQALRREADRAGIALHASRSERGASFRIVADSAAKRDAFEARMDGIIDAARRVWLDKHARRAVGSAIYVDHPEAARRYVAAMVPVAQALRAQAPTDDVRAQVARALNFIQAIPYDDLLDARTTGGVEFAPPPALLRLNRGDCDSKVVALAAILRTLTPRLGLLFVVLPQHVALAVDLRPGEHDIAVVHGGRSWLLLEPTGPAVVQPGRVAPTTAWYIDRPGEVALVEMKE
jgi:hypothetical protein